MYNDYEDRLPSIDADVPATPTPAATQQSECRETSTATPDIVEDVLIEEVSIDGMCGVY